MANDEHWLSYALTADVTAACSMSHEATFTPTWRLWVSRPSSSSHEGTDFQDKATRRHLITYHQGVN